MVRLCYSRQVGATDYKNGMRLQHTIMMQATGSLSSIVVTAYGLTEKELLRDKHLRGILPISLEGFCYGGTSNVDNKTQGYIIFMRSETNGD